MYVYADIIIYLLFVYCDAILAVGFFNLSQNESIPILLLVSCNKLNDLYLIVACMMGSQITSHGFYSDYVFQA